jgi:cysteine desulfurase
MLPWLKDQHANPHSAHREGRAAKAAVEVARDQVAALLPTGGRVAFTGGATEALNWAIKGAGGPIVTIATEHAAVLDTAEAVGNATILRVGRDGLVDLEQARAAIRPGMKLVAAMLVNNEIGVVQPVAELAALAQDAGAVFLCDAVQGYGRESIPDRCDLIAISAHKIHGPKGIGALWIRDGIDLAPLLHGGNQEGGRSGTLSPALCAGFGVAAALMAERREQDAAHVERLWELGVGCLDGWAINGLVDRRYRGNLNIRRDGLDVARLISDLRDVAFSAGSACASGSGRPSHVLQAISLSDAEAKSSIRLGFGRYTTEAELIDALTRVDAAARAQRIAA